MSLDTFNDPNLAAVLIKKFLRDLPTPIFPEDTYPVIQRCPIPSNEPGDVSTITYIRETILPELPRCSYILLSHVLRECSSISGLFGLVVTSFCLELAHEVSIRSAYSRRCAQPRPCTNTQPCQRFELQARPWNVCYTESGRSNGETIVGHAGAGRQDFHFALLRDL